MAVKLRLRREGAKKQPHYRVVAADARSPRDGRFIEIIGEYHPGEEPSRIEIDEERALYWLRNGAQATGPVENLLRIAGIWERFKPGDKPKRVRAKPAKKAVKAPAPAEKTPAEEAPVTEPPAAEEAPATEPPAAAADELASEPPPEPGAAEAPDDQETATEGEEEEQA
jgi:small subunit ribosomal protein S16